MTEVQGQRSITIKAPTSQVYEYIADFSRHQEWNHQVVDIEHPPDEVFAAGTTFRTKERPPAKIPLPMKLLFPLMMRFVGIDGQSEAEIVALDPEKRIAWKAALPLRKGGYFMKAEWVIELEPANGATRVTQHFRFMPQHARAQKMMKNEAKSAEQIGTEVSSNLQHLKEILEAQPSPQG